MPKLRKVDGAWRNVAARYRKIAGQWRRVKESYRKVDGVWVKIFGHTFISPIVRNPDPQNSDANVYFDEATQSWKSYITGNPSAGNTVEVGLHIHNIPAKSRVSVKVAKYDNLGGSVVIGFYSNGVLLSGYGISVTPTEKTLADVSDELSLIINLAAGSDRSQVNFALYEVTINGEVLPLI